MEKMSLAAKYGLPIIAMIDTPGAYPGIGAEERGQAMVIAQSMMEMSRFKTPDYLHRDRRRGLRRGPRDRRGRSGCHFATCLLFGHQPRGLCRNLVEKPQLRRTGGPGVADHLQAPERDEGGRRRDRRAARAEPIGITTRWRVG